MNTTAKSRSVTETTVPEVKNSRTESKSRIWLARMPTEAGRCAIFTESTCSKMFEARMTSSFLPVMSMMRLRTMRMTKSKINRDAHADRQRDQRGHGAVRHHAVVDVHDEEGARQREHVHDQRGDRDVAVVRPEAARRPTRTSARAAGRRRRRRAHRRLAAGRTRNAKPRYSALSSRSERDWGRGIAARIDDRRRLGVEVDREQNARRAVAHREHGGQHQRGDFGELAPYGLAFEAGLGGGALEQRRRQPAVEDRQAGQQGFAADRAAMMRGEEKQRVGQRIPGGLGRRGRRLDFADRARMCRSVVKVVVPVGPADKGINVPRLMPSLSFAWSINSTNCGQRSRFCGAIFNLIH